MATTNTGNMVEKPLRWFLIYDDEIKEAFKYDSVLSFDYTCDGKVLSVPIEEGSFATYDKTMSPSVIKMDVAITDNGDTSIIPERLETLEKLQNETRLLRLSSSFMLHENYTLESYSYAMKSGESYKIMTVSLTLVKVKEVETQYTTTARISKSKKKSDNSTKDTGKKSPKTSALSDIFS